MNRMIKLIPGQRAFAIAAAMAVSAISSQAQDASATISGVFDSAHNVWDYTITLTDTGTTSIGNFWYAWTPDVSPYFYLPPGAISSISGQDGWTGSAVANSIQFVDNGSGNALTPTTGSGVHSVALLYDAAFSPTDLANTPNSGLSVAYSGSTGIESGSAAPEFTVTPVAAPEPMSLALLAAGFVGAALARSQRKR